MRRLGLVVFLLPLAHALLPWEESEMNRIVSLQHKPQPGDCPEFKYPILVLPADGYLS